MEEQSRTVKFLSSGEINQTVIDQVGHTAFYNAIGYLSSWNMSYPNVVIFVDQKELEIQASYRDEKDNPKYFICGVWHGDHYGFHS